MYKASKTPGRDRSQQVWGVGEAAVKTQQGVERSGRLGTTAEVPEKKALGLAACCPGAGGGPPRHDTGKPGGGSDSGRHLVSTACVCRVQGWAPRSPFQSPLLLLYTLSPTTHSLHSPAQMTSITSPDTGPHCPYLLT